MSDAIIDGAQPVPPVEYRPVPGFPNYRAGTDGTVQSRFVPGTRGRVDDTWRTLKPVRRSQAGYQAVILWHEGRRRQCYVHALVLEVFIGPRQPGQCCRHLDGDSNNNRRDNLAWGTQTENVADQVRHGTFLRGSKSFHAKLNEGQVVEIRRRLLAGEKGYRLAQEFGVSNPAISRIRLRQNWSHIS
jgi:hypothetical protein